VTIYQLFKKGKSFILSSTIDIFNFFFVYIMLRIWYWLCWY